MKTCPHCQYEQADHNRFCEECSASLLNGVSQPHAGPAPGAQAAPSSGHGSPVAHLTAECHPPAGPPAKHDPASSACTQCGAPPLTVDADGFCTSCGHQRVTPIRDHFEETHSRRLAGVTDRGLRHHRNEDHLALATDGQNDVLVVCDGVSSSQRPDEASATAAQAACATLWEWILSGGTGNSLDVMRQAVREAENALLSIPWSLLHDDDSPETTIVAAVRQGRKLTVGWLGDSRAYLFGPAAGAGDSPGTVHQTGRPMSPGAGLNPGDVLQLTQDHSWIVEMVGLGLMTKDKAKRSPQASHITKSLGGKVDGSEPGDEPTLITLDIPAGARALILCTDGFWNHVEEPEQVAAVFATLPADADALTLARQLVQHAKVNDGHDNITVAVLLLDDAPPGG